MRQARPIFVLFLCLLLGAVSRPLFAQATGTVYGTVYDASGAAVPGAQITARNSGTNAIRSAQSDEQGQFVISLLPVGEYSVKIDHAGFTPFEQTSVLLQANTTVQVNANLAVKTASEQVIVTASQNLVQANASSLVQVVDERRVADLPLNGRNVLQLITLNAGIADSGAAGSTIQNSTIGGGLYNVSVSVNGSRGDGTNYSWTTPTTTIRTLTSLCPFRIRTPCRSSAFKPARSMRSTAAAWAVS